MNLRLFAIAVIAASLVACASNPGRESPAPYAGPSQATPVLVPSPVAPGTCHACGHVARIDVVAGDRRADGSGAAIGGVVGGVLGNQADNRATATGSGNAGQKPGNPGPSYDIRVQMDDGRKLILNQRDLSGIAVGSYVDVYDNRAHLMR